MLYNYIRMIKERSNTFTDLSLDNQEEGTAVLWDLDNDDDYIYIGKKFAFNNFFLQMDTVNAISSNMEIQYWAGKNKDWVDAVDILDGTSSGGVTLAKDGVVQFSPSRTDVWQFVSATNENQAPDELAGFNIFNVYWLRIKFSATLTPTTAIERLIYCFSRSQQLDNMDTDINKYLDSFESGKTNWDDEIVTASMQMVGDLQRMGLAFNEGEVLRFDDVSMACDQRALALVYANLGPSFLEKRDMALTEYNSLLTGNKRFTFDLDGDGFEDTGERKLQSSRLIR